MKKLFILLAVLISYCLPNVASPSFAVHPPGHSYNLQQPVAIDVPVVILQDVWSPGEIQFKAQADYIITAITTERGDEYTTPLKTYTSDMISANLLKHKTCRYEKINSWTDATHSGYKANRCRAV